MSPGARVVLAAHSHTQSAAQSKEMNGLNERSKCAQAEWEGGLPAAAELVTKLEHLLTSGPVNLARVSEEIRAHPDLEAMVIRLGGSLGLADDSTAATVERAAVALGTDRLLILLYAWSLLRQNGSQIVREPKNSAMVSRGSDIQGSGERGAWPAPRFAEAESLERVYLASFLHWLGLDFRNSKRAGLATASEGSEIETEQFVNLTEVFMRDFIALIPFLDHDVLGGSDRLTRYGAIPGKRNRE